MHFKWILDFCVPHLKSNQHLLHTDIYIMFSLIWELLFPVSSISILQIKPFLWLFIKQLHPLNFQSIWWWYTFVMVNVYQHKSYTYERYNSGRVDIFIIWPYQMLVNIEKVKQIGITTRFSGNFILLPQRYFTKLILNT